jgi:hypothetical protein
MTLRQVNRSAYNRLREPLRRLTELADQDMGRSLICKR